MKESQKQAARDLANVFRYSTIEEMEESIEMNPNSMLAKVYPVVMKANKRSFINGIKQCVMICDWMVDYPFAQSDRLKDIAIFLRGRLKWRADIEEGKEVPELERLMDDVILQQSTSPLNTREATDKLRKSLKELNEVANNLKFCVWKSNILDDGYNTSCNNKVPLSQVIAASHLETTCKFCNKTLEIQ